MKDISEYQKEFEQVISHLKQLEEQKQRLTTRAVELQGIIKEMQSTKE